MTAGEGRPHMESRMRYGNRARRRGILALATLVPGAGLPASCSVASDPWTAFYNSIEGSSSSRGSSTSSGSPYTGWARCPRTAPAGGTCCARS